MKYSILHISDIHKIPGVEYDPLVQSLRRDLDLYTTNEGIIAPYFIVVSGDLIQGAYSENDIREQYNEVETFLKNICEIFLQNDRNRIIIVPGNHDVSRVASKSSMIPTLRDNNLCKESFFSGAHDIRWSWAEQKFYEITDTDTYSKRFELFIEFYNRFFDGIREYPKKPEEQAYVVINHDKKVCFACFNSCNHLDHLCDTGCISDDALTSIGKELTDCHNSGYLNIAVWHHHFYGRPMESNYMDRDILNDLLSCNINMGLFGHQHYSQVAEEYSDLLLCKDDSVQKMLLVSSGTLFGGKKVLAENCRRQYNIIEIDYSNGFAHIDINIREDFNPKKDNKIPRWKVRPLPNSTNKVHYDIPLRKLSADSLVLLVDRQCKVDGDFIKACESIKLIEQEMGINLNTLFKNYLKEVKDYNYMFANVGKVQTVEDALLKIVAARETNNPAYIADVLADTDIVNLNDSFINTQLQTLK